MRQGVTGLASSGLVLLLAGCVGEHPQTTIEAVTEFGRISESLWANVLWWTLLVLAVVFGVLLYIVIRFRERPDSPEPKRIYGSTLLELLWTLGPAVIIVFIAVPTIRGVFETQQRAPGDALVIDVIGHQWWWEFRYPEQGVTTANEIHVPTGRPIELRLRSADVIHSFWIPRWGGKRDVNPLPRARADGRAPPANRLVFTVEESGAYLGQCAEYCGLSHAIMRMMGVAQSPEAFDAWVQRMQTGAASSADVVGNGSSASEVASAADTPDAAAAGSPEGAAVAASGASESAQSALAQQGREIFMRSSCIACHAIAGTSARGQIGPNLTLFGDRWSIGAGLLDNTQENLERWLKDAPELKKGIVMPGAQVGAGGMPPTGLSDDEVRAVAAYLLGLTSESR